MSVLRVNGRFFRSNIVVLATLRPGLRLGIGRGQVSFLILG